MREESRSTRGREDAGAAIMARWRDDDGDEEPAGESGMVTRMVRFVSNTIKWSMPSKERHGEKNNNVLL